MSWVVSISAVLIILFIEEHNFCAIKVIQFQSALLGQKELRELDICIQKKIIRKDGPSTLPLAANETCLPS